MTAITFNTLEFSRNLQSSGFSQEQADAMAQGQFKAMTEMMAAQELATKNDLKIALAETKNELMERIAESKHETLKWLMGMLLAQTALLIGVIAFIK
ncbi:MAG: hypothetical protein R3Y11_11440 [Pseudomonadota bacterium]